MPSALSEFSCLQPNRNNPLRRCRRNRMSLCACFIYSVICASLCKILISDSRAVLYAVRFKNFVFLLRQSIQQVAKRVYIHKLMYYWRVVWLSILYLSKPFGIIARCFRVKIPNCMFAYKLFDYIIPHFIKLLTLRIISTFSISK